MRDVLRSGGLGLQLEIPSGWSNVEEREDSLRGVDEERQLQWFVLWAPGLWMDLSDRYRERLERSLHGYARKMFDDLQAVRAPELEVRPLDWSPIIEAEVLERGRGRALRMIHRISYHPGSEVIMGHLVFPLEPGLLELRCVAAELGFTGIKESTLVDEALAAGRVDLEALGETAGGRVLAQSQIDDAQLDERFPEHPLSRVRRGLDSWPALEVSAPAAPSREITVGAPPGTLTLPPGFAASPSSGIARSSFGVSDGIEHVIIDEIPSVAAAERALLRIHRQQRVKNTRIEVRVLDGGRRGVVVSGEGHQGPLRNVFVAFESDDGRAWVLGIGGDNVSDEADLFRDLMGSAETWSPTPGRRRKWLGLF